MWGRLAQKTQMETVTESDPLPFSALQHFAYCPRQFALIHIDQQWAENCFTAEGQVLHQRVNEGESETRGDLHVARSLRLTCRELSLWGVADVVEFHRVAAGGCRLSGRPGLWQPYPVEYKRGHSKADDWDRLQLCAQAMALEEMLGTPVPEGAIFYGKPRRRERIGIDERLRDKTRDLVRQMHRCYTAGVLPPVRARTKMRPLLTAGNLCTGPPRRQ